MELTTEDVSKLKVVEIRKELDLRGLNPSGSKSVLIERLTAAIEEEITKKTISDQTMEEKPQESETKSEGEAKEEEEDEDLDDGELKPKHQPIVYNIPQKDPAQLLADEEEKKRRRAERFGPVEGTGPDAKRVKTKNEGAGQKLPESEAARMEMRAKRFAPKTTEEAKDASTTNTTAVEKKTGVIDLSHIVSSSAATEEEKKKRRAERFGPIAK